MKKYIFLALLAMATTHMTAQEFDFNEVTYTPAQTTFRLFAPKKAKVSVEIGSSFLSTEAAPNQKYKMRLGKDGIWTVTVNQDLKDHKYWFEVDGKKSVGVFAKAVGVNSTFGVVADLRETNPDGWGNDQRPVVKSPSDLVIYEMHHRDFSIDESSGLKNKGKFLALTESKAIKHLKDLGVNAVHILPSYDFGSVNEMRLQDNKYNWGYDPVNYNVPEAGIRVILDVVYNHTYDIENSNFQKTYPDYYYRKNADGTYSNGSGCGNETASEQPMMRRFMIESVKYWINEYHIDGFRFDLMGCHDIETMNAIRKAVDEIDSTIFIYGEGWSAGQCALPAEQLAAKANIPHLPRIAAFSDELRDGLRGPFSDDTKGAFLAGLQGEEESIKFGIAGCIDHPQVDMSKVNYCKEAWATEPTQMISYVSCHDDMCLVDRLKASIPGITTDEIIRLDLLAQTAVFTSQGVPFMLSGEEMLRDKKGVHNSFESPDSINHLDWDNLKKYSFESPDSINHLDWDNLKKYPQVFQYYKNLIQLRKNHPAFRLGSASLVRKHLVFGKSGGPLVFCLKDHAGGDRWKDIYVILNASREQQTVDLPMDSYETVCDDGRICETGIRHFTADRVTVAPQSALILHN